MVVDFTGETLKSLKVPSILSIIIIRFEQNATVTELTLNIEDISHAPVIPSITLSSIIKPSGKAVLKLLQDACRKNKMTVVVITHNQALTAMADRIITVKSGTVHNMEMNQQIVPVEEIEW